MKTKIVNVILWLALLLAMSASITHLAWTFGTVERVGYEWLGWIPALAVDTGLAALAYTIQQRKRAKRPVAILWAGVVGFAAVSALANFYHALAVEGFAFSGSWVAVAKAVVLSATLPVAYIFLGEIISGDDATLAERATTQAEREQRRADRQAEKDLLEAKRVLLEAENEQTRLAQVSLTSEPQAESSAAEPVVCQVCEREFDTLNALNAHMRIHKNGSSH